MVSQIVYIVWYVSLAYSPIHHFPRQRKQQQYSRIRRSNKLLSLAIVNSHSYTRAHTKSSRHFENFCFILSLDAILFFCFRSIYKSCRVISFANFVSFAVTMRCSSVFCVYVLGSGNALGFTRFVVAYKSLVRNATRWLETRLLSSTVRLYYLFQRVYFGRRFSFRICIGYGKDPWTRVTENKSGQDTHTDTTEWHSAENSEEKVPISFNQLFADYLLVWHTTRVSTLRRLTFVSEEKNISRAQLFQIDCPWKVAEKVA